jgi:replicative DNA helicase
MSAEILDAHVPPHDLNAEAATLSAVMLAPEALSDIGDLLHWKHFYSEAHGRVFEAVVELEAARKPCDIVQVATSLRESGRLQQVGGMAYLTEIINAAPAVVNVRSYAETVFGTWRVRQMQLQARAALAKGYGDYGDVQEFADETARAFHEIAYASGSTSDLVDLRESLVEVITDLQRAAAEGRRIIGLATGLDALDRVLGGLHDGELTIIAARPGKGKSSAALQWCVHAARGDFPAAVFSLEMPRKQLTLRAACMQGRIDVGVARTGQLTPGDWSRLTTASSELSGIPLFIDDTSGLSAMALRSKLRRKNAELSRERPGRRLRAVVVDYLQLMRGSSLAQKQGREREVAEIAQDLKEVAKEFNVPVVALSQMNRAIEQANRRPRLSDLRESGNVEQAADNVVFIHEQEKAEGGRVEFVIEKQRSGPTDIVEAIFERHYTRFADVPEGAGGYDDRRAGIDD